ncbi:MAG: M23 family metallopeptidase, partial [Methanothrix sp.]
MQEGKISSNKKDKRFYFHNSFNFIDCKWKLSHILILVWLYLLIIVPSSCQDPETNLINNTTSVPLNNLTSVPMNDTQLAPLGNTTLIQANHTELNSVNDTALISANRSSNLTAGNESQINEVNLVTTMPEALIVLPEQILPETVVVSMAAIYNNTSAAFLINDTNITGDTITIEAFSVKTGGNHTDYTIQPAQVTLNNLSTGRYNLMIKDRLAGLSLYNSSFYVRPFGQLFQEDGLIGNLQTYKGGLVNDTIYLVSSPFNPVCAPGLFNYTHVWANSTDRFFLGLNLSNAGNDMQQINLTIRSENEGLKVTPSYTSVKSLDRGSSLLMPFEFESADMSPGIYNLTYNLTYARGSVNQTLNGRLHIGIYSLNASFGANETINIDFISPFNDRISQSAQDWVNYSVSDTESISLPGRVIYNATYGNFTLQEPNSPWLHVLVGAAVGSVIGSSTELAHQCLYQQRLSLLEALQPGKCQVDWADVAYETGKTGVAGGVTAAVGPAVISAVVVGVGEGALIESGVQTLEMVAGNRESLDLSEIAFAGVQGASDGVVACGATKAASGIAAKLSGMGKGMEAIKSPGFMNDAFRYVKESLKSTTAEKVVKAVERSQLAKDARDYAPRALTSGLLIGDRVGEYVLDNAFQDKYGTRVIRVPGQYQGFNSPEVDRPQVEDLVRKSQAKVAGAIAGPRAEISDVKLNGTIKGSLTGNGSNIAAYKISVIWINQTFNESEILDGDEIILLNRSFCGDNSTPAGSFYPSGWSPAAGDYVEVYARTAAPDRNWTALGLNNSSKVITLCGEYGFRLKQSDIHQPVLSNGTVTPQSGRSIDDYTFSVIYRDEDGDLPASADMRITGFNGTREIFDSSYAGMARASGDARSGIRYEYTTKLPLGEYQYYFFFKNQKNQTVYFPEHGSPGFFGPAVGMSWPLRPVDAAHPVILGYGDYSIDSIHNAVDIPGRIGEGVYAVETGTVVRSDKNRAGQTDETLFIKGDYSNKIIQYTHIAILDSLKKDGARLNARDLVGRIKQSDDSGFIQPHLHFAIVGDDIGDGVYVPGLQNPLLLLEPRPDYGEPPEVRDIAFREDDAGKNASEPLGYFQKDQDGVYEVCGNVDIVASVADAIGAHATAGAHRMSCI